MPFAARAPLAHWSLKSASGVALPGIEPDAARGVLCSHAPLYPMLDTCNRAAVARCWRAIRTHFLPLGPPVGQPEEDEDDDAGSPASFDGGGGLLRLPSLPSPQLEPGGSSRSHSSGPWQHGRGVAHLWPLAAKHPHGLDRQRAGAQWCGPLTLHGVSQWLNARGETFPGRGFPYDEVGGGVTFCWLALKTLGPFDSC